MTAPNISDGLSEIGKDWFVQSQILVRALPTKVMDQVILAPEMSWLN